MPVPSFGGLPPYPTFEDVTHKVNRLVNELRNLLLNLDSLNIVSLTADHIDAGTILTELVTIMSNLSDGAYIQIDGNGMVINDGTKDVFSVNTSGQVTMTGATIQSATGYPKVVMDPDDDLLAAYQDADSYAGLIADNTGVPAYVSYEGGFLRFYMNYEPDTNAFRISAGASPDLIIQTVSGDLRLLATSGNIRVTSFAKFVNNSSGDSLQDELDAIWDAINDLEDRVSALEGP